MSAEEQMQGEARRQGVCPPSLSLRQQTCIALFTLLLAFVTQVNWALSFVTSAIETEFAADLAPKKTRRRVRKRYFSPI